MVGKLLNILTRISHGSLSPVDELRLMNEGFGGSLKSVAP
jgi:hypothetical protein